MGSTLLTTIIVCVYLLIIIGVIVWSGKAAKKSYKDFALGGNDIPWLVVAGTMFASTVGGGTVIGYVGNYKAYGLQWGNVAFWAFGLGMIFTGFFLAPRLKNLDQCTTGDMLGIRYGNGAKLIASGLNVLGEIACVFSMTSSFITMASGYLGLNQNVAMILGLVIFFFTAAMGGLKGVAWTDAIQALVIFVTVAIVSVLSIKDMNAAGGLAAVPSQYLNPFAGNCNWMTMSGTILSCMLMSICMQSLFIQRINATKTAQDAKKATIMFALTCGIFMIVCVGSIGISSILTTPADVTGNNVVVAILSKTPSIIGALYAAAILAAVLTTANSMLLSCSLSLVRDFGGVINPELKTNDKKQLAYTKIIMAVVCVLTAFVVRKAPGIMTWTLMIYTIIGCIAFPLYYGLLSKKATSLSGVLGLALGGGAGLIWEILNMFKLRPAALANVHAIYFGLIFGILGCLLGNLSKKKSTPEQLAAVEAFTKNVHLNDVLGKAE